MQELAKKFAAMRVEEITQELEEGSGPYAVTMAQCGMLYENIGSIIERQNTVTIVPEDCRDFLEYFQLRREAEVLLQQTLYQQCVRDGVRLLSSLGALGGQL